MKRFKMLLVFVTALSSLLPALLQGQVDTAWVRRYNGPGNSEDVARAIAVDGSGNVYVTGCSYGSGTYHDYATIKYNANGDTILVRRYNGPGNSDDLASSLAVDGQGNMYVTGYSFGSGTSADYATIKYNSAGVEQWVQTYNGPGNGWDEAYSLAVNGQGNVYVTGYSYGSGTSCDYATIKYNANGDTLWVRRYNGPGNSDDLASSLAVDGQGNVYVTGTNYGSGTSADYATIKYNSVGVQQWVQTYNGPGNGIDKASSLVVDGQGNVYVTGYSTGSGTSHDYTTIKYNSAGVQQWLARYNGPGNSYDEATAIAVDGQGNVYVTGWSYGSGTSCDYATIKYNSVGVQQWVQRYNGPGNGIDKASSLVVDGQGNVYVTGASYGSGYATIKYNSAGVQQWIQSYTGPGNGDDRVSSLAVDGQGNVYVTGSSTGSSTDYDYATIKYVQAQGIEEIGVAKGNCAMTNSIEIYPNPAKTYFTIRLPFFADRSQIKIFDVTGKVVIEVRVKKQELRISLEGIKNGVYFVQVGNEMVKEKLVVTK